MSMNAISTPAALRIDRAASSPLCTRAPGFWQNGLARLEHGSFGHTVAMPAVSSPFADPKPMVGRHHRVTADAKQDRPPRGVGS